MVNTEGQGTEDRMTED